MIIRRNNLVAFTLISTLILSGCLQTRQAIRQKGSPSEQQAAAEKTQMDEINQDFRSLYGRVEVVEDRMSRLQDNPEINQLKVKVVELENKINLLEETVTQLNTRAKVSKAKKKPVGPYDKASGFYTKKKWEDAILAFEDYRKKSPKGKLYADATFKIGMSFKNLGMKQDAKAFFQEVVDRFPKSKVAKQAKAQIKAIKK